MNNNVTEEVDRSYLAPELDDSFLGGTVMEQVRNWTFKT